MKRIWVVAAALAMAAPAAAQQFTMKLSAPTVNAATVMNSFKVAADGG